MIKVRFKNFWPTFTSEWFIKAVLLNACPETNFIEDSINPDIEICSTFGKNPVDKNIPSVFWSMEGIWNIKDLPINDYDWMLYFFPEELVNHPNYCRINMVPPSFVGDRPKYTSKSKFCNFIYSNPVTFRNDFFTKFQQRTGKHIDAPGQCMNNTTSIGLYQTPKQSRTAKNWPSEKLEYIKNYKFTIAFENHSVPGYVTEKLIQPLQIGSIPIYWGNPYIHKDFNTKAFINYHDFNNESEFIDYIIEVDNNDELYQSILKEPIAFNHNEEKCTKFWNTIIKSV